MTSRTRRDALRIAGLLAGLCALVIAVTGGAVWWVWGTRIALTNAERPAILAAVLFMLSVGRKGLRDLVADPTALLGPATPARLAGLLVTVVLLSGLVSGSRVVGGADSYGYLSEADLWNRGQLLTPVPLATDVPWPDGLATLTPLGYVPAQKGDAIVPIYSPGYPLLMALAKRVAGHCAAFWIVPLCGALVTALTFGMGRRLGSDWLGLAAVWFLITSPTFLCLLMNPMSDVPATAFWALAIWLLLAGPTNPRQLAAGIAAGIAILIRPNLAPLALALLLWLVIDRRESRRAQILAALAFVPGVALAAVVVAATNAFLYGSPMASGYGPLSELFERSYVPTNITHWFEWLTSTQTPAVFFGLASLYVPSMRLWRTPEARRVATLLGLSAAVVLLLYVAYIPFDTWWFLRFLLPAWPAFCVGMAAVLGVVAGRRSSVLRASVVLGTIALGAFTLGAARARGVMNIQRDDQRYATVATLVERATDQNAVILAGLHSGSLRYYAGRLTLKFDRLDAQWLDRAVAWLQQRGLHPYILLDGWERQQFSDRFRASKTLGTLQLSPVFVYEFGGWTYLYDPLTPNAATVNVKPGDIDVPQCAPPAPLSTTVHK